MAVEQKIVSIPDIVIQQIRSDLAGNGVRIYAIEEVPPIFIQKDLIHPAVLEKSTCLVAGVSACPAEDREYIFLTAARLDMVRRTYVTDLDPIVMVYNFSTNSPAPSGVVRFHADFEGRTALETSDLSTPLSSLQAQVSGSQLTFEQAPQRFTEAMHFMADRFKKAFDPQNPSENP